MICGDGAFGHLTFYFLHLKELRITFDMLKSQTHVSCESEKFLVCDFMLCQNRPHSHLSVIAGKINVS